MTAKAALPCAVACGPISMHKLVLTPAQTLIRGILGGWCITHAVTMATAVRGGGGGFADLAAAIWFPISTYVACDFEHCLANMYFFAAAIAHGTALPWAAVRKNLLYSTAGNIIGAPTFPDARPARPPARPPLPARGRQPLALFYSG